MIDSDISKSLKFIKNYLISLQDRICNAVMQHESHTSFQEDFCQYRETGFRRTRVLEGGDVFERSGVNFSHLTGLHLPESASAKRPELAGRSFQAMGMSVVIHPRNPYVPTSHSNVRFFISEKSGEPPVWWFGGGYDLTPYYGFDEDCVHWHQTAKKVCDEFDEGVYAKLKLSCDKYFYLKHRKEHRGIGGLFFDDLNEWEFDRCFGFMQRVGDSYIDAYFPLVEKRKNQVYGECERKFQCYRRGRYVEFNLVYDRGTLFGLQSGGNIESILISMPSEVHWHYQYQPEPGSEEERLYDRYLVPRDWASQLR